MNSPMYIKLFIDFQFFQAAIGIANLIVMAMEEEGATAEEALSKIWMVDSRGLIVKVRMENSMIKQEPKNNVE